MSHKDAFWETWCKPAWCGSELRNPDWPKHATHVGCVRECVCMHVRVSGFVCERACGCKCVLGVCTRGPVCMNVGESD